MSGLNIQWTRGKPIGILAILTSFAVLTQIPMIYHARQIIQILSNDYLPAYITIIIAAVFILTNAKMILYEAFLIRLRSYEIKDYRAPFLSTGIIMVVYFIFYFVTYAALKGVELFGKQDPIAQYGFCQMISLILIMIISFWYNKRQTKVFDAL